MNKLDELKVYLSINNDIEFLFITETHLNKDILDAELQISGYSFIRRDRNYDINNDSSDIISSGGGSMIYYKDYININVVEFFDKAPDSLAISVSTSGGNVCLGCIYRSPSLSNGQNNNLLECIDKICHESNEFETVLIGDFNLPNVLWENGTVKTPMGSNNKVLINQERYVNLFLMTKVCLGILLMEQREEDLLKRLYKRVFLIRFCFLMMLLCQMYSFWHLWEKAIIFLL